MALVIVIAAIGVRAALDPFMGHPSVAVFMVAILAGAWFGGVGPAILCLVLLHIVHGYWFQAYKGLFEPNLASPVSISAWYAVGITTGVLSQMRTAAQQRAREEQREAASQREHLLTTLSCMADGVLVTDVDGRLTLMNPAAEALTGWKGADAQGRPWRDVFAIRRGDTEAGVDSPIDRVLHEGRVVHEGTPLVLRSRTGRAVPIDYSAAPVRAVDSQVTGAVIVFRDESERRRAEFALQEADRKKDEFLATLAHELRNPLAPICMGLDLLGMSPDDPRAAGDIHAMMQRQAQHMVRLIDDLLDVSRITRGKLELRMGRVEVADIVRDAVAASRPSVTKAEHQLTVRLPDEPLVLYADANRLTQVVTNLLSNAAKYTPRGGRIEVAAEHTNGEVLITVSDSGIGIPPDKLDSVFEMFTQVHRSAEGSGLGIGLTLVKRLVEMHGGRVQVHSRGTNFGTTFFVQLPVLAATQPPRSVPAAVDVPPHHLPKSSFIEQRRILVVDDNPDALESLSRAVAVMGHDVRGAHDGLEALDVGRDFQPEIVLMDLGMPNLDGYDAARRMRQESWGREILLVATTGWGQEEDRRRTAEAGFDRHLTKPVPMAALREVLQLPPLRVGPSLQRSTAAPS